MDNPQRKQCGKPECKRAFNAERGREWQRAYHAQHGEWCHRRYLASQRAAFRRRRQKLGHWRKQYPEWAAAYDARRRALVVQARTGEVFAPLDVHTRDGWICQLCHEPIDQGMAWPNPMSPSVDHVIPLSRGGAHALSNVQSAHLGCNSSKGDRDMDEAVALLTRLAGQA
ncbi:HNH endonuclease signature motif containing protein [Streptomyces sp. NPDC000351]|uniref:HNH endonuclease n=1 Tax=Streptomyces sp. NPDC000351 TaxID=3154250 RepID=UPI00331EC044